ncbi:hypothetical protein L596_025621 [Steinernema carpocapsae]|uniref:Uncharacterized protein n=1 Tax=Steinernema carpocapsae TaxID=34508 RepID=A0A4U5M8B7_STECR|nr:hypothetical protein L596_025621 [Steinernema carpocapsae]
MATLQGAAPAFFLALFVVVQNVDAQNGNPVPPAAPQSPQFPAAPQLAQFPTPQFQAPQLPQFPASQFQVPQLPQMQLPQIPTPQQLNIPAPPPMPHFQIPDPGPLPTPPTQPQLPMIAQERVPQAAELPGFREAAQHLPVATPSPFHSAFMQHAENFLKFNNIPYMPANGKTNPYNPYINHYYNHFERATPAPLVTHNPLFYNAQRLDFTPEVNTNAWRENSDRVMNSPYDRAVETPLGRVWLFCKFNCPRG